MMRKMMKGLGGLAQGMKGGGKNAKNASLNMMKQAQAMKHKYKFK